MVVNWGGTKNLVNDFSVKKNKYYMVLLLKIYRLLMIMKMFNVKNSYLNKKLIYSIFNYRNDLRFLNFESVIRFLMYFIKFSFKGSFIFFKDLLKKLIKVIEIKKNLFYVKNKVFFFNVSRKNKFKKRRLIDIFDEKIKLEKERRKKLGFVGRRLLIQKPLKDEISDLKLKLLESYQYLDQRKGFVYKKKILNMFHSLYKNKYSFILRKFLFFSLFKSYFNWYKLKWRSRYFVKQGTFKKLLKMWSKNDFDVKDFLDKFFIKRKQEFKLNLKKIREYKKFFRKRRTAILHFKSYYSNYYITLTDLSYNVIYSCSAGSVSSSNNKKTKTSTVVCTPMFLRILLYLRANRIRNLKFEIKDNFSKHFFSAFDFFRRRRFNIKTVSIVSRFPHHFGQRENKPRRI